MVIVPLPCRWGEQGSRWEVVPCKIAQGAVVEQASKSDTQVLWAAEDMMRNMSLSLALLLLSPCSHTRMAKFTLDSPRVLGMASPCFSLRSQVVDGSRDLYGVPKAVLGRTGSGAPNLP